MYMRIDLRFISSKAFYSKTTDGEIGKKSKIRILVDAFSEPARKTVTLDQNLQPASYKSTA